MKILIWSGYQSSKWNLNTWLKDGIGGSEYCILQLAIALNKLNHNVTVSGDVEEGNFDGVQLNMTRLTFGCIMNTFINGIWVMKWKIGKNI